MLFNSLEYVIFLCVVFLGFWALARMRVLRIILLMVASYIFYMSWNPAFALLIAGSTCLDYFCGASIAAATTPRRRKLFLIFSLTGNLSILAYFKYTNFFWGSLLSGAGFLGFDTTHLPAQFHILLPVGISFFTFQSMSYSLDIYRRLIEPARSFREFAFYVAFFPQLEAGPIVRAGEFLPQLELEPRLDEAKVTEALFLILKGAIKKVAVADYLAVNLVDRVYDNPAWYSSPEVALGLLGYSLQIYYDFSAYTDIARGSAMLFGFELPLNFQRPYQAQNVSEFWQRWHMSLTRWIRDYLYIPLGGSRGTRFQTYRNIVITWLLMGLWHGANWTFVAWGGFYALALSLNHLRREHAGGKRQERVAGWRGALATVFTVATVTLAWVPFRSTSFTQMVTMLKRVLAFEGGLGQISPTLWAVFLLGWALHFTPQALMDRAVVWFGRVPAPLQGAAAALVGGTLFYLADEMPVPFIYFQF